MPDLDRLLGSDFAGAASRSVRPPEFGELAGRGRRRRLRRRTALASVVAVVVVAGSAALVDQGTRRDSAPDPAPPSPTPTGIPSPNEDGGPTPTEVVDDPASTVSTMAVAAQDPDVRAVAWKRCANARCRDIDVAIAVTSDGFASRSVVGLRRADSGIPTLSPAGDGAFIVSHDSPHPYLLGTDGGREAIPRPQATAPLRPGEVLARWNDYGDGDFFAVEPATGATHLVPVPDGLVEARADSSAHLEGIVMAPQGRQWAVAWSDDGGAHWQQHPLDSGGCCALFGVVASADPEVRAVVEGADGATVFPFVAAWRGTAAGTGWQRVGESDDPRGYIGSSAVLPDGRLAVMVEGWSDDRGNDPGSRKRGLYLSDGEDWSRMRSVPPPAATGLRVGSGELYVVATSVQRGGAALYVISPSDAGSVFRVVPESSGGELTWTPLPAR